MIKNVYKDEGATGGKAPPLNPTAPKVLDNYGKYFSSIFIPAFCISILYSSSKGCCSLS